MNDLRLELVPVFEALLRYRHVGRAAEALGMSQPGVSHALRRLRLHFADPLFVRNRLGITPTEAALRLLPAVTQVMATVRTQLVPAPAFDPASSSRRFCIATSDLGELVLMPRLLQRIQDIAPGVRIETRAHAGEDLAGALLTGQIDLLVGYFPRVLGDDIFQQRLFTHGYSCIARKGHPAARAALDAQGFASLEHLAAAPVGRSQQVLDAFLQRHGVPRAVRLETPHLLCLPHLVAGSHFVAIVPEALADIFAGVLPLETFAPPLRLPRITVRQHWHRSQHGDPANRWLREVVGGLFPGPSPWRPQADVPAVVRTRGPRLAGKLR